MNWAIHLTVCIIFVFATWVYFLKCEINELRRRIEEHENDTVPLKAEETSDLITGPALQSALDGVQRVPHVQAAGHATTRHVQSQPAGAAPHPAYRQGAGIPTWKID
jgi:hypothetical protein